MRVRHPVPVRLYAPLAGALIGLIVAASGAGFAASLGVDSKQLTVFQKASTVPISTCTLTPSADSYVHGQSRDVDTNFGTEASLHVQSHGGERKKYTFVRFNIGSCGIPTNASVQSASLELFLFDAPVSNRTYELYRVTGNWTETGITWNNQPPVAASVSASSPTGTSDGTKLTYNVVADAGAFVSGSATNHGWRLWDGANSAGAPIEGLVRSREAAGGHPSLTITYYP